MSPQLAALMEWAGQHNGERLNAALTQDQVHSSTQLYYSLIMLVEGAALTRVINAGHGQGLNAWRMLVAELGGLRHDILRRTRSTSPSS